MLRLLLASIGTGLALCALSIACGPVASPAPSASPTPDAFAVVRATSQAAYQAGQAALARGDYLQACVNFDTAKTNDPDNRPEIQQALEQALARCLTPEPEATSAPAAASQRTLVVATIAAGVGSALGEVSTPTPNIPGQTSTSVTGASATGLAAATTPPPGSSSALATWNDPQGRFTIGAPPGWTATNRPDSLVGTGVVQFQDPSGRARLDVAVDTSTRAVSPELYAANLELAMQKQVPGYASEQVVPGTTAGSPSVQRVFTFTGHDASGQQHQVRGLQVAIVKGSTPYIISATAPAEQYDQYSATFNQMVGSFRFS